MVVFADTATVQTFKGSDPPTTHHTATTLYSTIRGTPEPSTSGATNNTRSARTDNSCHALENPSRSAFPCTKSQNGFFSSLRSGASLLGRLSKSFSSASSSFWSAVSSRSFRSTQSVTTGSEARTGRIDFRSAAGAQKQHLQAQSSEQKPSSTADPPPLIQSMLSGQTALGDITRDYLSRCSEIQSTFDKYSTRITRPSAWSRFRNRLTDAPSVSDQLSNLASARDADYTSAFHAWADDVKSALSGTLSKYLTSMGSDKYIEQLLVQASDWSGVNVFGEDMKNLNAQMDVPVQERDEVIGRVHKGWSEMLGDLTEDGQSDTADMTSQSSRSRMDSQLGKALSGGVYTPSRSAESYFSSLINSTQSIQGALASLDKTCQDQKEMTDDDKKAIETSLDGIVQSYQSATDHAFGQYLQEHAQDLEEAEMRAEKARSADGGFDSLDISCRGTVDRLYALAESGGPQEQEIWVQRADPVFAKLRKQRMAA